MHKKVKESLERQCKRGLRDGRNYSPPSQEGQRVDGLYCPVGWCKELHASMVAQHRVLGGKEYLVWVYDAPCLKKAEGEALKHF